jgi:hypothetical protein
VCDIRNEQFLDFRTVCFTRNSDKELILQLVIYVRTDTFRPQLLKEVSLSLSVA